MGSDLLVCSNDTILLNAGPVNGTYLWNDSTTLNTLLAVDSGTYKVSIVDSNGCSAADSVHIAYLPTPVLDIGSDTAICPNSSYVISVSGFNFYLWQDGSTLSFYNVIDSGEYSIEVYDVNACVWRDTVTVRTDTSLSVDIKQDTSVCFGDTVYLDAQNAGFSFDKVSIETSLLGYSSSIFVSIISSKNFLFFIASCAFN